jgi:hypothetical protein
MNYSAVEQENAPAAVLVALQPRSHFGVIEDALKNRATQDTLVLQPIPAHTRNLRRCVVGRTCPVPAHSPSAYVPLLPTRQVRTTSER